MIANAYDADAKNVYIVSSQDEIRIEDDGHGMSYVDGGIAKYLNVAVESRITEDDSFTKSGTRRKIGRKGVGKLAALSVSENVDVITTANGELSGFVLTRKPEDKNKLKEIPEDNIEFQYIRDHGTAIVMHNPQYRLHKTLAAVKRNLLKIFPLIDSNFRIHIIRGTEEVTIDDFDREIMGELSTLITLGSDFAQLSELVPDLFPSDRNRLVEIRTAKEIPITMKNKEGVEREYNLKIEGWIGTYKSTRGRKAEITDFPDNFISLFANKKMGEFNILPTVGQNKLNEVYVVGQLHADLFELTELPDIALSNRQGYKSDDTRYREVREYVRKELLADILKKREIFTDLGKKKKKLVKMDEQKLNEEKLKESYNKFRSNIESDVVKNILDIGENISSDSISGIIKNSFNSHSLDLGLKSIIDLQKKKILISQTIGDKPLSDILHSMLLHNNVPAEDILYTNCDDEVCRVPDGVGVYDYLRDFFVESYSTQKYLYYLLPVKTPNNLGALLPKSVLLGLPG
ncbi:MAG: ATP-binding protein [Ignavibacteriaceae bacterium]|nr:ATP-binding protein [Ignavibacteriaceae bacterium]